MAPSLAELLRCSDRVGFACRPHGMPGAPPSQASPGEAEAGARPSTRRRMRMNTYMEGVRDALARVGLLRSSTSAWMTGFAVGAGVGLVSGAVVALLITPTSGPEMRREIGWRAK